MPLEVFAVESDADTCCVSAIAELGAGCGLPIA
jgi:hypothetical protein